MVRPRVVVYNEVSIDGRVVGFETDPSRYYRLGFRWRSDAILMGSTTALAFGPPEPLADQRRALPPPERLPVVSGFESLVTEPRPLLVVPDSSGAVRSWIHALAQPWYRAVVVLVSRSTPRRLPRTTSTAEASSSSRPVTTASTWLARSRASRDRPRRDGGPHRRWRRAQRRSAGRRPRRRDRAPARPGRLERPGSVSASSRCPTRPGRAAYACGSRRSSAAPRACCGCATRPPHCGMP